MKFFFSRGFIQIQQNFFWCGSEVNLDFLFCVWFFDDYCLWVVKALFLIFHACWDLIPSRYIYIARNLLVNKTPALSFHSVVTCIGFRPSRRGLSKLFPEGRSPRGTMKIIPDYDGENRFLASTRVCHSEASRGGINSNFHFSFVGLDQQWDFTRGHFESFLWCLLIRKPFRTSNKL